MKYKLTNNTKKINGITLYQIQSLKDFADVKNGDLGGWIETEGNLSQEGNAWVSVDAVVSGNARVSDNAQVFGDAWVSGNALVSGNAWVYGDARVSDNSLVGDNAGAEDDINVSQNDLPDILSTLPKEVSSITISGKTYKLETKWVLQD
jgi:carbonic anhydrase/acetyltransferase-like protein (isoleucine patch superfamily)